MKTKTTKTIAALLRKGDRNAARTLGKIGGSVKSEAKTLSCRLNASKPRPNRRKKQCEC